VQTLLGAHFEVHNQGVSGSTMQKDCLMAYWKYAEFATIFRLRPNIITIKLGTNDSQPVNWRAGKNNFQRDLNAMIDTFQSISSHPQIFLVLPTPAFAHNWNIDNDTIEQRIIPIIKSVAASRNLPVIDCHTALLPFPHYFTSGGGVHPDARGADSIAHIIYRSISGKPYMELSDTLLTFTYDIGAARSTKSAALAVINQAANRLLDAVTLTKKASWLSVSVHAANPDSQVLTNQVDPAGIVDVQQKYFDTVVVHSVNSLTRDQAYRVLLWIRPAAAFSSVKATPESISVTAGQSCQLNAVALNQYGEPIPVQPAMAWQAANGVVSGATYTPPAIAGNYPVVVSAGGKSDTAWVNVHRFPYLPDTGYVKLLLLLERNHVPYIPAGTNSIDYNFLGNETTIKPLAGATAQISGAAWTWTLCNSSTGMWADSQGADNFVAYGAFYLYTPVLRTVIIRCKHDDIMKIWFNSSPVYNQLYADAFEHISGPISLAPGLTRVLVKLLEGGWTNYFAIRFADTTNANCKDLGYNLSPDTNMVSDMFSPVPKNTGEPGVSRNGSMLFIMKGNNAISSIVMHTIDGKIVFRRSLISPMQTISLNEIPAGIFFLELCGERGNIVCHRIAKIYPR
jgi:lysophospholipase L1-like esterase